MLLTSLFTRLTVRLLPLVVLLCAALPAFGGRPLSEDAGWRDFGFTACNLPCYVGITAGRTPFNEMPDLLRRSIPLIGDRMFNAFTTLNFWASLPHTQISGWARNNGGVVAEIRLVSPLPLDHLLIQLGTPDCVLPGTQRPTIIVWVRKMISIGVVLGIGEKDFSPANRVSAIWLRSTNPDDCSTSGAKAWHGFATVADYVQ